MQDSTGLITDRVSNNEGNICISNSCQPKVQALDTLNAVSSYISFFFLYSEARMTSVCQFSLHGDLLQAQNSHLGKFMYRLFAKQSAE